MKSGYRGQLKTEDPQLVKQRTKKSARLLKLAKKKKLNTLRNYKRRGGLFHRGDVFAFRNIRKHLQ